MTPLELRKGETSRLEGPRSTLYERDFFRWTREQAHLLRERGGIVAGLDVSKLAEEIEDLGSSQQNEIESRLCVLLAHLLKWQFQQSKRPNSWRATIMEQRMRISKRLRQSPSLRAYPGEVLAEEYVLARLNAAAETDLPIDAFPADCPFTVEQCLDPDYHPGADEPL